MSRSYSSGMSSSYTSSSYDWKSSWERPSSYYSSERPSSLYSSGSESTYTKPSYSASTTASSSCSV